MNVRFSRTAGWMMILFSAVIGASWTGLIASFDYPDVLRFETGAVLEMYAAGGTILRLYWAGMALSGLVLIIVSTMLHRIFYTAERTYLQVGTVFGIAAGVFNVLGFIRWVFSVKTMADIYVDPLSTEAAKEAAAVSFQVMHAYFGVSVGETLGYLSMSVWIVTLCIAILQSKLFHPAIPLTGMLCGIGTFLGLFEWFGYGLAAEINAYALQGWLLLLIVIGLMLVRMPMSKLSKQTA